MGPIREHGLNIEKVLASALRPVQKYDFEAALNIIRPSVSAEQIASFDQWTRDYGTRS
jgi:hypothetical protein